MISTRWRRPLVQSNDNNNVLQTWVQTSDVDPDPVGSGSKGIRWREKQSLINSFFSQEIIFFKSEPKKVANLWGLGSDLKILSFFFVLKSIWWFYWHGSGSVFIKFCGSGSVYNQSGSASLIWITLGSRSQVDRPATWCLEPRVEGVGGWEVRVLGTRPPGQVQCRGLEEP